MQTIANHEELQQWRRDHAAGWIVTLPDKIIHRAGKTINDAYCPSQGDPYWEPKADQNGKGRLDSKRTCYTCEDGKLLKKDARKYGYRDCKTCKPGVRIPQSEE